MKWSALFTLLMASSLTAGELPGLSEKPWIGWFAANEGKKFHFGVGADGRASLIPLGRDKEQITSALWIRVEPVIVERLPDGREFTRKVTEDGWEALSESSGDAESIAYRATVEGGARYEVRFGIDRDTVSIGGRLVELGELEGRELRLAFRVRVPDYYRFERGKDGYEKKFKRDEVELVTVEGTKMKFDIFREVDADEINRTAIESARIEYENFRGPRLELDSGEGGSFRFWNGKVKPLSMGYSLEWSADSDGKPDGEAAFRMVFK